VFETNNHPDNSSLSKINNYVSPNTKNSRGSDKEAPDLDIIKKAVIRYEERDIDSNFKNKLNMDFRGFFKYFCKCCCLNNTDQENNKILDLGKKFLTLKLDLTYYLKMTDQVNRLKMLLLKPYQILLLDNQRKINLLSNKDKMHLDITDEHFSSENDVHLKLVKLIIQKILDNNFEYVDSLLYENLEVNLKDLIDDLIELKQ
jgi:hypothetical protein